MSVLRPPSSVLRPPTSVILPIRNEDACIAEVLTAVLAQDYPHDLMEVIAVDGMSDDATRDIVRRLSAQDSRLKMLDNPRRITPAALNLGLRAARGDVIIRVDGHGVLPPNFVRECVAFLAAEDGRQRAEGGRQRADDGRQRADDGRQKTEDGRQKTEDGRQKTECGTQRADDGRQRAEDGRQRAEDGRQRTEDGRQRAEDGRQRTEDGRQRTEDGRQKTEDGSPSSVLRPPSSVPGPPSSDFRPPTSVLCPPSSDLRPLAVGGAWDCVGRGALGEAIALATSSSFGVGGSHYRTCRPENQPVRTDSVPFWAMRREVFERLGLFREEMLCHEDYEFNFRLRQAGGTILLLPWLRSKDYVRNTLGGLARQDRRYGFWKGRFVRSHPESLKFRHLVPPLFVAALLTTALAALAGRAGEISLGCLIGFYLCFLVMASVSMAFSPNRERRDTQPPGSPSSDVRPPSTETPSTETPKHRTTETPSSALCALLPLILATLHLAWGVGVWAGLLRGKVPGAPPRL